jgi:hypothetical protein
MLRYFVFFVLLTVSCDFVNSLNDKIHLIHYFQDEQLSLSNSQQDIIKKLHHFKIPVGLEPASLRQTPDRTESVENRIATSTSSHPIECRITLDKGKPGVKCIAPCKCTGSQKWVQLSILNKLRRKDPHQWTVCQTCRQPYNFEVFSAYGNFKSSLIGLLLNQLKIIRTMFIALLTFIAYTCSLPFWLTRLLVSKSFWQSVTVIFRKQWFSFS